MTLIDCREAVARMWGYLSEGLAKRDVKELETHLEFCERCCGELEFSRQLRARVAEAGTDQMPMPVRQRINDLLAGDARPGEAK